MKKMIFALVILLGMCSFNFAGPPRHYPSPAHQIHSRPPVVVVRPHPIEIHNRPYQDRFHYYQPHNIYGYRPIWWYWIWDLNFGYWYLY